MTLESDPAGGAHPRPGDDLAVAQQGDQWRVHRQDAHLAFLAGKRDHVHVFGIDLASGSGDFEFQAGCHGVVAIA